MSKKVVNILIIFIVIILLFLASYLLFFNNKLTDAKRFSNDYSEVGEENVFVYKSASDIVKILKNGTGVVFLGFPECPWCQEYAPKLNEVALDLGILEIYYFDIKKDRADNTKEYQEIVEILGDNLNYDSLGNHRVFVPYTVVVKAGEVLSYNSETSMASEEKDGSPKEYWTKEKSDNIRLEFEAMFQPIIDDVCNQCDE